MRRILVPLLLAFLLAGCFGAGRDTVNGIPGGSSNRLRERPASSGNDCAYEAVRAGDALIFRIHCTAGSGSVTMKLDGCAAAGESSWLSIETAEGRIGQGNATATVSGGGTVLAQLRIQANADEGKEAAFAARPDHLTLDLESWQGEWITAAVQCATA